MASKRYNRIAVKNENNIQFGDFKYTFKQIPFSMWENNHVCINEIQIFTCDNINVIKLILTTRDAKGLYDHFINLIKDQDSFYQTLQINNNEIIRLYGMYDIITSKYKIQIEKEQITTLKNKTVIIITLDYDDFKEFVFLFYFHFLLDVD